LLFLQGEDRDDGDIETVELSSSVVEKQPLRNKDLLAVHAPHGFYLLLVFIYYLQT